jgi:hypothetical protein
MKLIIGFFTVILSSAFVLGQFSNFNTQRNWSMNKKEFMIGGGATQFLGDLGGQKGIGKDYSLADMNFRATNFNVTIGYRYRFHPVFATSTSFNFGKFEASDKLTVNEVRNARQIEIQSFLFSLSQRFEYLVYVDEKVGKRNDLPGLKGMKDKNVQFYIYTGIGGCYFNPRGGSGSKYPGEELRLLSTEGQGYLGGANSYKRITGIIPFGFGYRRGFNRMWRVMIEATYYKTFTDYMDDVSTKYFDFNSNGIPGSEKAIYFANPSEDWKRFNNGSQRGDKQKDAFFYINIMFSKNVTYKSYERGRAIKWRGARAKF